jgi:hypothetical protein
MIDDMQLSLGAFGRRLLRWSTWLLLAGIVLPTLLAIAYYGARQAGAAPWWAADKSSTAIAPDPRATPEAIVQVYAARVFGWRAALGVHTWIATKARSADHYTRLEVIGWGVRRGLPALRIHNAAPDTRWYGHDPVILAELRGADAEALIERIHNAARSYPYADRYTVWPGPNSNTFTAYVARQIPELRLDLPTTAIGKDFLGADRFWAPTPSGTGIQFSARGLAGFQVAWEEGIEFNLLGLSLGIDLSPPALRLPGLGRLGMG